MIMKMSAKKWQVSMFINITANTYCLEVNLTGSWTYTIHLIALTD